MVWPELAAAGVGAIGGLAQAGADKRHGWEAALKAREALMPTFGFSGDQFSKFWHDVGAGTFNPNDPAYKGNAIVDIMARGGIGGVRQEYMDKFLQNIKQGYAGAGAAVQGAAKQSRQGILKERTQGMADVGQSMADAGLQSSNIAQQAKANVSYQTSQAMTDVNNQLAKMMSDLQLGKSQAMDSALARNLNLETQTNEEFQRMFGNAGYGPYGSSMLFGNPQQWQTPGVDLTAAGGGAGALTDLFKELFKNKGGGGTAYPIGTPATGTG